MPDGALVILAGGSMLISLLPMALLLLMKLETTVTAEGLRVRLPPLANKLINFEEIAQAQTRRYRPLREFGGWGVRWTMGGDMAYNATGDIGVQLVLTSGKRILIGSQRAEELERALKAAAPHIR